MHRALAHCRRTAREHTGHATRPPLRRRPSGDRHCGHDGADRRRRRGARRRHREHGRIEHCRCALGTQVRRAYAPRSPRPWAQAVPAGERFGKISGMVETAENLARKYGISREASDAFAAAATNMRGCGLGPAVPSPSRCRCRLPSPPKRVRSSRRRNYPSRCDSRVI